MLLGKLFYTLPLNTPSFSQLLPPDTHINLSSDSRRTKTSRRRWIFAISSSISSGIMVVSAMEMMSSWSVWERGNVGVKNPVPHRCALLSFQDGLDPATFARGKGARISVCTASDCLWDGPVETGKHVPHGNPVVRARGGSGGLSKPVQGHRCGLDSPCLVRVPELLLPWTTIVLPCPSLQDQVQL